MTFPLMATCLPVSRRRVEATHSAVAARRTSYRGPNRDLADIGDAAHLTCLIRRKLERGVLVLCLACSFWTRSAIAQPTDPKPSSEICEGGLTAKCEKKPRCDSGQASCKCSIRAAEADILVCCQWACPALR